MSDHAATGAGVAPPPAILLQMMTGYWASQALYVAAKLGVADQLADGPVPCEALAAATGADAPSLRRVLRALASVGVFTEAAPDNFALTPLAGLLRTGTPGSMRALAIMYAEEQYRAWGDLLHSVRTGTPAFSRQFGMDYFAYLATHPEADRVFNAAMTGWTDQLADAVVDAYDFSPFGTVVDVGGSYGTLLTAILRRHPGARGILFDQPHVVADAAGQLAAAGVADRCTAVGGDFFRELPAGADAYVLAQILHDWDDERSTAILARCHRAMAGRGALLLSERVLPVGADRPWEPFFSDLHMLQVLGGRERTEAGWRALLAGAGFTLTRIVPTASGFGVIEARPAHG